MSESETKHWASNSEIIEAFILHQLEESVVQDFTEHLQLCKKCHLRVQTERDFLIGIRRFGRLEMKRRLQQQIHRDRSRRFEWSQVASIAAAIVVMIGAVFTLRWFVDFDQSKLRNHEITIDNENVGQRPLWITGRVVIQRRTFKGTLSEKGSSFVVTQGNQTETISIKHARRVDLPPALKTKDESVIHTLVEHTSQGLQLTLYKDIPDQSTAAGIEAISADSLIVFLNGQQIAFHIPGGWAGNM